MTGAFKSVNPSPVGFVNSNAAIRGLSAQVSTLIDHQLSTCEIAQGDVPAVARTVDGAVTGRGVILFHLDARKSKRRRFPHEAAKRHRQIDVLPGQSADSRLLGCPIQRSAER